MQVGAGLSWKVKIHKENLYNALQSSSESHSVHIWKNNQSNVVSVPTLSAPHCSSIQDNISIVTWNCRGYHNSKHYLQDMIAKGADIIVLQEHWLWPYELPTLSSLHPDFTYTAVSDKCLHPTCDLKRGCGGVAILWNKSLKCSPISAIDNDRICGVRVLLPASKDPQRYLTILGLYMPSAELPQETLSLYLESVEHLISQLNSDGPLLVVGDFNAHLGSRDSEDPHSCNYRGNQWNTHIEDHTLYNVSLGCGSTGPTHTFASGGNMTTIDYVLTNQDALPRMSLLKTTY